MIACEHNLFEEDGQAVANVLSLTVHENYGPFGYENDICLVEHDDVTGLEYEPCNTQATYLEANSSK